MKKSAIFRKDLERIKDTFNTNYKEKDNFINKQHTYSRIIDKILKENNIHLDQLVDLLLK